MKHESDMAKLSRLMEFLERKYHLSVVPLESGISMLEQVAEMKYNRLVINTSSRGLEGTIFVVAHVFGHLVQYATKNYGALLAQVSGTPPLNLSEEFKQEYFAYEIEAYEIGRGLIEQALLITDDMDKRYQAFKLADLDHFWHYLVTGVSGSRNDFDVLYQEKVALHYATLQSPMKMIFPPESISLLPGVEIIVV